MKRADTQDISDRPVILQIDRFDAVLFDMDGVVTKTAIVHARAWKRAFDEFLKNRFGNEFTEFTMDDYRRYVDGKPRYDGVKSFLTSRGVELPWGSAQDKPGFQSICAVGNLKNSYFTDEVRTHGVEAYDSTIALIQVLRKVGIKCACITASNNGEEILKAANAYHLFDAHVNGLDADRLNLKGKPYPDTFLEAARQLAVDVRRAVVVEDAAAGVQAGRDGGFGLVIGVSRNNHVQLLKDHGADVVVFDLSEVVVSCEKITELPGMAAADLLVSDFNWVISYDRYDPEEERRRETLCSVGNGYFETRGAAPESRADAIHYPGTYLAGGYDRAYIKLDGEGSYMEREDLVNMPNWLPLTFKIDDGPWFDLSAVKILEFEQKLNLREGILYRRVRFRDDRGRETTLEQTRFVHMRHFHLAGLRTEIVAHNWSAAITVRSALDGSVDNSGSIVYQPGVKHLELLEGKVEEDTSFLRMRLRQCQLEICQAARTILWLNHDQIIGRRKDCVCDGCVGQDIELEISPDDRLVVDKIVSFYTGRDSAISDPAAAAIACVRRAQPFEQLLEEQVLAWRQLWRRFDLSIETLEGHPRLYPSQILHLHGFHVLQTASPNTVDLDVGIPARGWTGEAYLGHIFWDSLYVFPYLNLRAPEVSQALLKYRYRRLDEARRIARSLGVRGARYPWESASTGQEETPPFVWNKEKGVWRREHTCLEMHVNAAIAYDIWAYFQATGNLDFMLAYGAEMLFEIARFFAGCARFNRQKERYEILSVVGPDEYHSAYPGSRELGINNNAYTNVMAVWTLARALELLEILPEDHRKEISEKISLTIEETTLWERVSRRMFVPLTDDGLILQFEGYDKLEEFPWQKEGAIDLEKLHKVLKENDGVLNQYKVAKQADVLVLFFLLSPDELTELFRRLGYELEAGRITANVDYYIQRSANDSTLSRIVNAWVLSRVNRLETVRLPPTMYRGKKMKKKGGTIVAGSSWEIFMEALSSDFLDIQGGTTREGIHIGAMAGTLDIVQRCYTGIVTRNDVLWLDPILPDALTRLSFNLHYRHQALRIEISHQFTRVTAQHSSASPIKIGFNGRVHELQCGQSKVFSHPKKEHLLSA